MHLCIKDPAAVVLSTAEMVDQLYDYPDYTVCVKCAYRKISIGYRPNQSTLVVDSWFQYSSYCLSFFAIVDDQLS